MCDHQVVIEYSKDHPWREVDERKKPRCFWWNANNVWLWHCNHEKRCVKCNADIAGRYCGLGRDGCPDFAPRDDSNFRGHPRGWRC